MNSRVAHARRNAVAVAVLALFTLVAGCAPAGSAGPQSSVTPAPVESFGPRPSSPASLTIIQPQDGATLTGTNVHVSMTLANATITSATATSISPNQGHIHLYVNGALVSMNYSIEQDLPVTPGTYAVKAEFVAADHAPFSPRVWSNQVVFTVT